MRRSQLTKIFYKHKKINIFLDKETMFLDVFSFHVLRLFENIRLQIQIL